MKLESRNGIFYMDFSVNGERVRKSTKRPTSDEVGAMRVMVQAYNDKLNETQFGVLPEISLQDAAQRVCNTVEGKTLESYSTSMARGLGLGPWGSRGVFKFDSSLSLSKLSTKLIRELVEARKGEGLSNNTINIEVRFWRRVHHYHTQDYATASNIKFEELPKFIKTRFIEDFEEKEIRELILSRQLDGQNVAWVKAEHLFTVLIDTGLRLNEALGISWRDVNLPQGYIEVYRSKTRSISNVPISDRVEEVLNRYHNQRQIFEKMDKARKNLAKAIHEICNDNPRLNATRGKATIHTLRDTFVTRLANEGMSLDQIGEIVGHSSINMTQKYAHLSQRKASSDAREVLNRRLTGS